MAGVDSVFIFKYLGCVLDRTATDGAECSRKLASGRRVVGAIRSLVNARDLQLESVQESCMKYCLYLFVHMAER